MSTRILLIGMMGCGKTTVGKIIAKKLGLRFIDIDKYVVKKEGKTVSEIFEISESYFRALESEACRELSDETGIVISSGGGVVLRHENMECFEEFTKVYINRSCDLILRTVNRRNRPLLKNGDDLFIEQYKFRQPLYEKYKDIEVISDSTAYKCADKIIRGLGYEKNNGN